MFTKYMNKELFKFIDLQCSLQYPQNHHSDFNQTQNFLRKSVDWLLESMARKPIPGVTEQPGIVCKWINEVSQPPCSHPVKRSSQTSNERQPLSALVMELLYTFNRAILRSRCAQNPTWNGSNESSYLRQGYTWIKKVFRVHWVLGFRYFLISLSPFLFS